MRQFLNGRRIGLIGTSEEKDEAMAQEQAHLEAGHHDGGVEEIEGVPPQISATLGMPERTAAARRQAGCGRTCTCCPRTLSKRSSRRSSRTADNPPTTATPPPAATTTTTPTPHPSPPNPGSATKWRATVAVHIQQLSQRWCADRLRLWQFGGSAGGPIRLSASESLRWRGIQHGASRRSPRWPLRVL